MWFDVGVKRYTTCCIRTTLTNLFNKSKATICEYIFYIFKEEELEEKVVCRKFRQTTQYGALEGKTQSKEVKYYNLEGIISVGYRVKTIQRFMFRLLLPQHSSPSGIAFDSFSHRIRLLQPSHSSPSAIGFVSFGHRIRLLQPPQPSHSANAFDSFSHRSRLIHLMHSTHSANSAVCVNSMK